MEEARKQSEHTPITSKTSKYGNINDPESIKLAVATHFKDRNTKRLACCAYDAFLKYLGISWEKPDYKKEHKREFIPTEDELQLAINSGHKDSVVYSRFLYETGARANEAARLEWTDLDRERNKVTVKASKHGNSRVISILDDLMVLLFSLPKEHTTVFCKRPKNSRSSAFHNRMIQLSKIHNNPRMLKIHLHTFRHCKALREYHKTLDPLHVMWVLGHKSILTTMRYIQLYKEIYGDLKPENYISKVATTKEERQSLIESGYEWIGQDNDGLTYFRKVNT